MDHDLTPLGVILGLLVGFFVVRRLAQVLKAGRPRRRIARVTRTAVAALTEGQWVKVRGRVRLSGEPLAAPYTDRPCVAYDLLIEHRPIGTREYAASIWHEADAERGASAFVVEDDTGAVLVDATTDTSVFVLPDLDFLTVGDNRAHVLALLSRKVDTRNVQNDNFRYSEWCLEEGAEVAVVGRVARQEATGQGAAGYRDSKPRWQLVGTRQEPLHVTDRDELVGRSTAE